MGQQFMYSLIILKMKSIKIKKMNNNSFVSNHDLLQCIRNKSFVGTKDNTSRLHTNKSKISLLQKKSYERLHTMQENNSLIANTSLPFIPSSSDKAIVLVQDCITSLIDTHPKIVHKLKKVLTYLRDIQNQNSREDSKSIRNQKQGEKILLRKLQISCEQKAVLKLQNEELKSKLNEYREKMSSLIKKGEQLKGKNGPSQQALNELIINQSGIIDRQCEQNKRQGEQMRRLLQIQAQQIEQMMKHPQNNKFTPNKHPPLVHNSNQHPRLLIK